MNLTCNLYVDGEFEGIINSEREVNIGKNGKVKGDIFTKRLVVQGFMDGNVNSNRIEIKAGGHISGSIESSELVIEAKGIFEGNSVLKDANHKPPVVEHKIEEK
jgi:cytoskeletal protein CcmA (bactofilin family)